VTEENDVSPMTGWGMCQNLDAQGLHGEVGLVEQARGGDLSAFEALVAGHRDRVYGLALRLLSSPEAAAEVTQGAFLSAYAQLGGFQAEDDFGRWVRRAVAKEAVSRLREAREACNPPLVFEASTGPEFADAELWRAIEVATASLPDECREAFVLRDLEDVAYEEIAELTRASIPVVKGRLHRARLSLRGAIEEHRLERR
jgi:RNA polymerase sigma-70 factor (ECF subfamily)